MVYKTNETRFAIYWQPFKLVKFFGFCFLNQELGYFTNSIISCSSHSQFVILLPFPDPSNIYLENGNH